MAEEKKYTLRDLKGDDIFLVVNVIRKIGFKELKVCFESLEVRKAIAEAVNGNDTDMSVVGAAVMFEVAGVIVEHLPECRQEINTLLAELSGMSREEVGSLPFGQYTNMVMDVIRKEEFKDFFTDVFGLPS